MPKKREEQVNFIIYKNKTGKVSTTILDGNPGSHEPLQTCPGFRASFDRTRSKRMTHADFLKKHGPIARLHEQNTYFSRLCHPVYHDGEWQKGLRTGIPIFHGVFTNIGYFRHDQTPEQMEHNWEALDYEIELTQQILTILKTGNCLALDSEGEAPFFPFIFTVLDEHDLPDNAALGVLQPPEVAKAYAKKDILANYEREVIFYDRSDQTCIFWDDDNENFYEEDMEPEEYKGFREASDIMKSVLTRVGEIHYYSDYLEFPAIYGGKDEYGHFVGVITSVVWT